MSRKDIISLLSLLLLIIGCNHLNDQPTNSNSGYSRGIKCGYAHLMGIKAHGDGFCIEPHTVEKANRTKQYVLMVDYDTWLLENTADSDFRESTGESKGRYRNNKADPGDLMLCNKLDRILITSSADFNDVPAGESLNSKFMIFTWTVWPSVKAQKDVGYQIGGEDDLFSKILYFNPIPTIDSYSPVTTLLDELSEESLYMISGGGRYPTLFMFTELPRIQQHVFTITYYDGENSWSVDIPADFETVS